MLLRKLKTVLVALMMMLAASMALAASPASPDQAATVAAEKPAPDEVVKSFYKWYLAQYKAERFPLRDDRAVLKSYITKSLLYKMDHGGPDDRDADYFTKSQDIVDEWDDSMLVKSTKIAGNKATVVFTMGKTELNTMHVTLTLRVENGAWKIQSVHDDAVYGK